MQIEWRTSVCVSKCNIDWVSSSHGCHTDNNEIIKSQSSTGAQQHQITNCGYLMPSPFFLFFQRISQLAEDDSFHIFFSVKSKVIILKWKSLNILWLDNGVREERSEHPIVSRFEVSNERKNLNLILCFDVDISKCSPSHISHLTLHCGQAGVLPWRIFSQINQPHSLYFLQLATHYISSFTVLLSHGNINQD